MALMQSKQFIAQATNIAKHYNTLYVMGCFGAPLVGSNVNRYCNNHSYNKQASRTQMIKAVADKNPPYFGFDCSGLIKGILWGWCGNVSKTYGGAAYGSNGVPDKSADSMIKLCKDVSTDFSKIIPGEAVWVPGHIGIYVGDGLVVECTPQWANDVQFTALGNIGTKSGYNTRKWTKHGKLPYVDYSDYVAPVVESKPATSPTVKPTTNPTTSSSVNGVSLYYPKYTGTSSSLDAILKAIGVPAQYYGNYNKRKPLAEANGISGYEGTGEQNTKLKSLARSGQLKRIGAAVTAATSTSAYYPKYTGPNASLDAMLKAIGVPAQYTGNYRNRTPIATANGITGYSGSEQQNIKLKELAKAGKLKKVK